MDKLSEQVVCKIVGECTLADIGRVRDALLAVHGDAADNMKLWDVWKAGLKRMEILEPAKVEAKAPVPFRKESIHEGAMTKIQKSAAALMDEILIPMWGDGKESFTRRDVFAILQGETKEKEQAWNSVRNLFAEYGISQTGKTAAAGYFFKKESK